MRQQNCSLSDTFQRDVATLTRFLSTIIGPLGLIVVEMATQNALSQFVDAVLR